MINVFVEPTSSIGYVWNTDDWKKLREVHHIVGHLTGTSPKNPRQEVITGLPLTLHQHEITLLKEKNIIKLVHEPSLVEAPSDDLKMKFEQNENTFHLQQHELFIKEKELYIRTNGEKIARAKTKRMQSELQNVDTEQIITCEIEKLKNISPARNMRFIETNDPWIDNDNLQETKWEYPKTKDDLLQYRVFKDLWERNYYLTSGSKFGGDFLCYMGDPAKFHASFIVIVIDANKTFQSKNLVIYGRIGTSTKKTVVLASDYEEKITYQSLQWVENTKI